jgi:uncharacterized protein YkwD
MVETGDAVDVVVVVCAARDVPRRACSRAAAGDSSRAGGLLCFVFAPGSPFFMQLRNPLVLLSLLALVACAPAQRRPEPAKPAPQKPPAAQPSPESLQPVPPGASRVSVSAVEQKVIEETNAFRKGNGLPALKPSVRLLAIAQNHARNMARQDKFGDSDQNGHVLDGRNIDYRIKVGGYAFAQVAENVGYQLNRSDPAAAMMDGWKKSSGHRRNMLLPDISEIGVGAAQGKSGRWYFVQVFGRPQQPPPKQALLVRDGAEG